MVDIRNRVWHDEPGVAATATTAATGWDYFAQGFTEKGLPAGKSDTFTAAHWQALADTGRLYGLPVMLGWYKDQIGKTNYAAFEAISPNHGVEGDITSTVNNGVTAIRTLTDPMTYIRLGAIGVGGILLFVGARQLLART